MSKFMIRSFLVLFGFAMSNAFGASNLDQRIVGKWEGMREESTQCQFLSWKSSFTTDGRFEITFFANKEKTDEVSVERGTWKAKDGRSELKTDGVPTAEVYLYTFIDRDTIKYVNTVKDASADCQDDYEFTERRAK